MWKSVFVLLLWPLILIQASACSHDDGDSASDSGPLPENFVTQPFPDGFVWGSATAGFQSDMGCPSDPCNDTQSDWYQWATTPQIKEEGLVLGDDPNSGPGQWELYEEDFDRAQRDMGQSGERLSIEWSRLFPQPTDGANTDAEVAALADPAAVQRYHEIFQALRDRHMTPLITLNHYTVPLWLHDGVACHNDPVNCENRGWLDTVRFEREIVKFTRFIGKEYGAQIDLWGTFNEPFAVVLAGFVLPTPTERTNPPGIRDLTFNYGATVVATMIESHARMYDALHETDTVDADGDGHAAMVGLIPNLAAVASDQPDTESGKRAERNAFHLYNRLFLDALVKGEWDPTFDGTPDEIREDLKGRMDFVAINYYTRLAISSLDAPLIPRVPLFTFMIDPFGLGGYYPPGIYEVCTFIKKEYNLPIYISESGLDTPVLAWLRKAIAEGADVRGFFNWTFVDNYEWNHGFSMKFGLYSYDPVTKERHPKENVDFYRRVIEAGGLTQDLVDAGIGEWMPPRTRGWEPPAHP